jgi:uncharacterized protein YggE
MSEVLSPLDHSARASWWRRWASLLLALVTLEVVVFSGFVGFWLHSSHSSTGSITVTATGTVRVKPNTANFQVSLTANASTATEAVGRDNLFVSRVIAALERHHATKSDMQTQNFSVNPNYNYRGEIIGYAASNTISVTMTDMTALGGAIDAAVNAGGNDTQINGITFTVSHKSRYQEAARMQAGQNARTKASQIAAGTGATISHVLWINEVEYSYTPHYYPLEFASVANEKVLTSVPVASGTQSVSSTITVKFELN